MSFTNRDRDEITSALRHIKWQLDKIPKPADLAPIIERLNRVEAQQQSLRSELRRVIKELLYDPQTRHDNEAIKRDFIREVIKPI